MKDIIVHLKSGKKVEVAVDKLIIQDKQTAVELNLNELKQIDILNRHTNLSLTNKPDIIIPN